MREAICESRGSEKIVKFVNVSEFTENVQELVRNGDLWGVYYNKNGECIAEDVWGETQSAFGN